MANSHRNLCFQVLGLFIVFYFSGHQVFAGQVDQKNHKYQQYLRALDQLKIEESHAIKKPTRLKRRHSDFDKHTHAELESLNNFRDLMRFINLEYGDSRRGLVMALILDYKRGLKTVLTKSELAVLEEVFNISLVGKKEVLAQEEKHDFLEEKLSRKELKKTMTNFQRNNKDRAINSVAFSRATWSSLKTAFDFVAPNKMVSSVNHNLKNKITAKPIAMFGAGINGIKKFRQAENSANISIASFEFLPPIFHPDLPTPPGSEREVGESLVNRWLLSALATIFIVTNNAAAEDQYIESIYSCAEMFTHSLQISHLPPLMVSGAVLGHVLVSYRSVDGGKQAISHMFSSREQGVKDITLSLAWRLIESNDRLAFSYFQTIGIFHEKFMYEDLPFLVSSNQQSFKTLFKKAVQINLRISKVKMPEKIRRRLSQQNC